MNEGIKDLVSLPDQTKIAIGDKIELNDNRQILLSREDGGRLVVVQLVDN